MSEAPSWLTEETAPAVTNAIVSNPAVQKAAVSAAKNPSVQKAAINAATGGTYIPPPVPGANDVETGPSPYPAANSNINNDFDIDEKTLSSIKKAHLALRVLYMTTAVLLGLAAGLTLQKNSNLGVIFFCFYVLFFSLVICCFEVGFSAFMTYVAMNFGFLYTRLGRAVFLLFVGFMTLSFKNIVGYIAMAWLYLVGLVHVYIQFRYPRFEEYVRREHYYTGKKI